MDDRDLERLFAGVRTEDERHAPPFGRVVAGRRAAARAPRLRWALALAVVAVVAVGLWRLMPSSAPTIVIALTPGDMRVPTDYLLDMVTYPRAGEIPRIGAADWYPLPQSGGTSSTRRIP
jgi:hypothetical protein